MSIRVNLKQRMDLSPFLIHLTRDDENTTALGNLKSIISKQKIEARNPFGIALNYLEKNKDRINCYEDVRTSQKCVCFTETPLNYIKLMCEKDDQRSLQFSPYGICIPKSKAVIHGANPVWYVDITPGHNWLTNNIGKLLKRDEQIFASTYTQSDILKISPYIETMGSGSTEYSSYRKQFSWEREWRVVGDFDLLWQFIVICPENDFGAIQDLINQLPYSFELLLINANWAEETIQNCAKKISKNKSIVSTSINEFYNNGKELEVI